MASKFDSWAVDYDKQLTASSSDQKIMADWKPKYNFNGSILHLGCGTGIIGHALRQDKNALEGDDVSKGMAEACLKHGIYSRVHAGSIQRILPMIGPVDS